MLYKNRKNLSSEGNMHYLFESADILNTPIECFYYDPSKQPFPIKMHWHYFMEIIYILEGTAEMRSDDKTYLLSKGDMIIFYPETVHGIFSDNDSKLKYAGMKFDINTLTMTSSYTPKLRSIFKSANKRGMDIVFRAETFNSKDIEQIFTTCIDEMQQGRYGSDIIARARIYELLTRLLRYWQSQGFSVDNEVFAEDSHYDIYNITEYIDMTLSDGISVSNIASVCGMSYSYFAKRFLAIYGKSCKEYIEQMRLYRVEDLLVYTEFDLNYIAQETGYSDCSHMIKSFKKSKGLTPKQFRLKKAAIKSTK